MSDETQNDSTEIAEAWIRENFDRGVREITERGVLEGDMVEARVAWALPKIAVIGQVRETYDSDSFLWLICGGVPTDHIGSGAAETPRDALRHFSLKWQKDAAQYADPEVRARQGLREDVDWEPLAAKLAKTAEGLYEIVDDDQFWQRPG